MISEGLCTTGNEDGTVNVAPMGPVVDETYTTFLLRPWQGSRTLANLLRTGCAVFHVTDDVELMARAALGDVEPMPALQAAVTIPGFVLKNACRWFELRTETVDANQPRHELRMTVTHRGTIRDCFGFNRAKHAVLEAAILATRLHLLPAEDVRQHLKFLAPAVEKTGGPAEVRAWAVVRAKIESQLSETRELCD